MALPKIKCPICCKKGELHSYRGDDARLSFVLHSTEIEWGLKFVREACDVGSLIDPDTGKMQSYSDSQARPALTEPK